MLRGISALLLLLSATAAAQIYRSVDPDGNVEYSDRVRPGSSPVTLGDSPGAATAPGSAQNPGSLPGSAAGYPPGAQPAAPGPYTSFEILSPQPNETLRQAEQRVPVSLLLDPPLMAGHRLELLVDGIALSAEVPVGTQMSLDGISHGSHFAQAQIRDAQSAVVARTAPVPFHLRKPIPPGVLQ